ncbi:MAG: hypothetical protein R3E93_09385 [Thiothrix sp.]
MTGLHKVMGMTVILMVFTSSPAYAYLKYYPIDNAGNEGNSEESWDFYGQLKKLLGANLYGHLLGNDEFLQLQEIVIAHFGDKYMVAAPPK